MAPEDWSDAGRGYRFARRLASGDRSARRRSRALRLWAQHPSAAHGLDAFLEAEFERYTADPNVNTLHFGAEDSVEAPLVGALLRAEALADWHSIRQSRARLARARLIGSVGASDRQPEPAFHLLRRADDRSGLQKALRWYRYEGPLEPLRAFGESVAALPWLPAERLANLAAVRDCADVLTPESAEAVMARLLVDLPALLEPLPTARPQADVIATLGALVEQIGAPTVTVLSRELRTLALEREDPVLRQSIAPVVQRLDPRAVGPEETRAWREFAERHVSSTDDLRFVAHAALNGVASESREAALAALLAAYRTAPALDTAAVLLDQRLPIPAGLAGDIAKRAREQLGETRNAARAGRFGFGEYVDIPLLLARLLTGGSVKVGWRDLVGFLTDPFVPGSKKARALGHLAWNADAIPASARRRLTVWNAVGPRLPFETDAQLVGAILRLKIALRAIPEPDGIAALAELATSLSRAARYEASLSGPFAVRAWASQAAVSLLLGLARDPSFEVRGAAGRGLASIEGESANGLRPLVLRRVADLLRDAGAIVPQYVLAGLASRSRPALPSSHPLHAVVAQLAASHVSAAVRRAAGEVLSLQ